MYRRKDGLYEKVLTENGIRTYFRGRSEREVYHKIKKYEGDLIKGRRLKDVADEWKDNHFSEIAFYTAECYKKPLEDVKEYFGEDRIPDITPVEIQAFIVDFARGRARNTVKLRLTVLRQIFDYAILNGELSVNPAAVTKIPKTCKSKKRELPSDEDINIIKTSLNKPFGLYAFLSLYTGCRRGEALALMYDDVNRKKEIIHINKAIVWKKGAKTIVSTPKSESGIRDIPLLSPLAKALPKNKKGFIFGGDKPLSESQFKVAWKKYKKITGIECVPHQIRHAYATILFEAGIDSKDAKELLGHSKESTTREIYTHIKQSRNQETIKKLNLYINSRNAQ